MFSLEVTLGNLLTAGSIVFGWGVYIIALKGKIDLAMQALTAIDRRITAVEATLITQSQAFIQLAKQEVLLNSIEDRVQRLEQEV